MFFLVTECNFGRGLRPWSREPAGPAPAGLAATWAAALGQWDAVGDSDKPRPGPLA